MEMFGYFAALLLVISFSLRSIIWQRWFNIIGCFCLAAYGMMIDATPIVVLNFYLVGMNLIQLWLIYTEPVHFRMMSSPISGIYVQDFLERNLDDIKEFFPEFALDNDKEYIAMMIHRNLTMVGLLICHRTEENTVDVDLDFVLPPYRDMEAGRFIFHRNAAFFRELGIFKIISKPGGARHTAYLQEVGFLAMAPDRMVFYVP